MHKELRLVIHGDLNGEDGVGWGGVRGRAKKAGIYVSIQLIHSQQKLTQIIKQPYPNLKSRDITLPKKPWLAMVFPVVMYGCESWTVKKAERRKIDAFELWCWRKLLRVPWTARRSNQSILKEMFIGRTDAEAETPILWPPDVKSWLTGKDPDAGRDWGQGEKGTTEDEMAGWHHRLDGHEFGQTPGVGDGQGGLCAAIHGASKSRTRLRDWTELIYMYTYIHVYIYISVSNKKKTNLFKEQGKTNM